MRCPLGGWACTARPRRPTSVRSPWRPTDAERDFERHGEDAAASNTKDLAARRIEHDEFVSGLLQIERKHGLGDRNLGDDA